MSNKSSHSPPPTNSKSDNKSKDNKSAPTPTPTPSNSNPSPPPPTKDSQRDKKSKADTSTSTSTPPSKSNSSPPPSWLLSSKVVSSPSKTPSPQSSPPAPSKSPPPPSPPPPSPSKKSPPPPPNKKRQSPPPPPKEQSEPPPSPSPPPPPSDENSPQSSPEKTPPPPVISPPPSSTTNPTPPPSSSNTLEASTSLPVVSPTQANLTVKASPELTPDAVASHAVPSPPGPSPSGGSSNETQSKTNHVKHTHHGHGVIINATVAGAVVVIAFIALFFLIIRRRRNKQPGLPGNHTLLPANVDLKSDVAYYKSKFDGKESTLVNSSETPKGYHGPELGIITGYKTFFTYEELMEITNGFARENVIGEGGFGCVYKGRIPDGRLVAVKRLKVGSVQGEREFKAEVEIISRIHHRHLVSLVGYCIAENQRLLIYDFVRNKTLEHHLHGKGMPVLEWANRVKIAIGAAKGLAYLHEDCQPRIIHRDIKPANILLDDDFEAQAMNCSTCASLKYSGRLWTCQA